MYSMCSLNSLSLCSRISRAVVGWMSLPECGAGKVSIRYSASMTVS